MDGYDWERSFKALLSYEEVVSPSFISHRLIKVSIAYLPPVLLLAI